MPASLDQSSRSSGHLRFLPADDSGLARIIFPKSLPAGNPADFWNDAALIKPECAKGVVMDLTALESADGATLAYLLHIENTLLDRGVNVTREQIPPSLEPILAQFPPGRYRKVSDAPDEPPSIFEQVGTSTAGLIGDLKEQLLFVGELTWYLVAALRNPRRLRWKDALRTAETAGVDALPIVVLIGFLIGLIMAFQAAIPMKQFGTEIFVANLVALSMLRELGPLMTAIVLAGRSGSAFAAELGTMKVNEEIAALTTMGLEPVRFLVIPRVVAAVIMVPFLTVFAMLAGLAGGWVVYMFMGLPTVVYINQITDQIVLMDPVGGLIKAMVFGFLVAAVGCLRGLQTRSGASAVGVSTTRSVVSAIVLIAITDGIFAVLFYSLGI